MKRSPYDWWCNTCGKVIPMDTWNENDGECAKCKQWWAENSPDEAFDESESK